MSAICTPLILQRRVLRFAISTLYQVGHPTTHSLVTVRVRARALATRASSNTRRYAPTLRSHSNSPSSASLAWLMMEGAAGTKRIGTTDRSRSPNDFFSASRTASPSRRHSPVPPTSNSMRPHIAPAAKKQKMQHRGPNAFDSAVHAYNGKGASRSKPPKHPSGKEELPDTLSADVQAMLKLPDVIAAVASLAPTPPHLSRGQHIKVRIFDTASNGSGLGLFVSVEDPSPDQEESSDPPPFTSSSLDAPLSSEQTLAQSDASTIPTLGQDITKIGDDGVQPSPHVFIIPFTVTGDTVLATIFNYSPIFPTSEADLVKVLTPSQLRDDSRIRCRHFGQCGGCQYQMLDYEEQLKIKRRNLERSFSRFSNLAPEAIPAIAETIPSPLTYNYRTKLTPHFDGPSNSHRRKGKRGVFFSSVPAFGFNRPSGRHPIDIEDCALGTDIVRHGLAEQRSALKKDYATRISGATILIRESNRRIVYGPKAIPTLSDADFVPYSGDGFLQDAQKVDGELAKLAGDPRNQVTEGDGFVDIVHCVTNSNNDVHINVQNFLFKNPAGAFFQNNSAILPVFTSFIRDRVLPPPLIAQQSEGKQGQAVVQEGPYFLVDAYCGSGLFTITLASKFAGSIGIDIDIRSIKCANENAVRNSLLSNRVGFQAADATKLFQTIDFPPDQTVFVIDPPRRGCDMDFLHQVLAFGPRRIVYVSCNANTQARDIGCLVRGVNSTRYEIESITGLDMFPQTHHVESIAFLNKVNRAPTSSPSSPSLIAPIFT